MGIGWSMRATIRRPSISLNPERFTSVRIYGKSLPPASVTASAVRMTLPPVVMTSSTVITVSPGRIVVRFRICRSKSPTTIFSVNDDKQ